MAKALAEMTAAELESHAKELDAAHKLRMNTIRALARANAAEEAATPSADPLEGE